MEEKIVTLTNFIPNIRLEDLKECKISRNLKHLCIYSRSGVLSVYVISQNISCIQRRIWQSTDKIKSFAFSDDGSQLLTINEHNILELYKLQDSSVEQLKKHHFSLLAETLGLDEEDLGNCKNASILFFSKLMTIMFIEDKWMLHFKMGCFQPSDVKKIDIPYCLNVACTRDYVFSLTAGGNISITSIECGEILLVLNLYSLLKVDQPDHSHRFTKIAVSLDGCTVAAVDSLEYIYILDITNLFPSRDKNEHVKESCASTASVSSFASRVSSVTTISTCQSSFKGDEEMSFKSAVPEKYKLPSYRAEWKKYLNSLKAKAHHSEDKYGQITAECSNIQIPRLDVTSDSMFLNEIYISEMGTSVWYTSSTKYFGGIYCLYDTKTGEIISEIEVSEDTFVIPGGFSGHVDGFLSPSKLCMYLGTIRRDVFISKIMQCMDAESVGQLFLEEEWQDLVLPLTALTDGLKQHCTDAAHLAFGFHAQAFRNLWLADSDKDFLSWKIRIEKCEKTVKNLFSEVEAAVEENYNDISFLNHLIHLTLNHANDLLHILHDVIYKNYEEYDSRNIHFAKILVEQIMRHVINLRKHLKQLRKGNSMKALKSCPLDYLCEDMKLIWEKWELCKDEDVIYDSVMTNNMPLAQTFLIKVRDWPVENVSKEIKRITGLWIRELIKNNEIETTTTIFKNLGYKAKEELREICIKSSDKEIRDNSAEYLFKNNWLQPQEAEAWKFLHTLEAYLEPVEVPSTRKYSQRTSVFKQKRPSLSDIPVTSPEILSIETVLSQPSDWKALVLTELFFNIPGSSLSGLITSHDAWKYLLNNNRDDMVICWIDSFYSNGNPSDDSVKCIETWFQKMKDLSFDIVENPQLHTPEEIIQIFLSWHINQELIDYVQEANAMQVTKDFVLDHLTRYGVFNSCDKTSPTSILSRLGKAKLLHKLVDILKKPTSNLDMELFSELLATYCLKNQLFHLPFVCFENSYFSENRGQELSELFPQGKRSGTHWFELWFKYKELLANKFNTTHVYDTIITTIKYLSPSGVDLYLSEHSLLVVALIIFSGVSLKHVYECGQVEEAEINMVTFQNTLLKLPLLEMALKSSYKPNMCDPDITVYQLLEGCMPFDVSKLFRWQALHTKTEEVMPHFTHEKLVAKYGYKCSLDYIYYLKQGRPSFAVNTFIVEQFRSFKKISNRMIKHACNSAHGVALQNFSDTSITSSCISFIGMLGIDTQALRINIHAAKIILKFLNTNNQDISDAQHKETVALLLHGLAAGNNEATIQILNLLEHALYSRPSNDNDFMNSCVESLLQWQVAVKFARLHNLQLPQLYLLNCASNDKWLPFILFVDIYEYPIEQVLDLSSNFKSSSLQEHLFHSLGQMYRFSPDKENIKLLPRDTRKLLYSRIGVGAVDDNQSDSETSLFIQPPETATKANSIISAEVVGSKLKKDLFLTLLQCHSSPDPPRAFLDTSVLLSNPVLSVLAACYEPSSLLTCFCNWILASLPPVSVTGISPKILSALQEQVTSASHVEAVLELAVSERYTSTLSKGFNIFFPDNPLCTFCDFLDASTNKKDFALSLDKLKQFSTSCLNLKNNSIGAECNYLDGTFFHDSHWILLTAIELIVIALSRCFTSSHYELMFLQVICESNLCEDLPVESPNFRLIGEVIKILSATQTKPDLQLLCLRDQQQQELNICTKGLVEECAFDKAIQLAVIGDLPKDDIIMSQLSHEFMKLTSEDGIEEGNMKELFWDKCHKLFVDENTEPLQVAKFFQSHSDKLTNGKDKYYALYYSLKWYKKARYESDNLPNISDETIVELNMWSSWLQLDVNLEKEIWQKFSSTLFYTKSDLMEASEISSLEELVCDELSTDQLKLHKLIGSLLDNGDHSTSCRLDQFFKLKNRDLQILLTCMELAEGILTPYQLSAEQRLLITSNATKAYSSGRYRRRTLKSFRSSAVSSVPQSLKSYSLSSEHADASQNDNNETLNTIEKFSECVKHGKSIANKIVTCYRISLYLEISYKEVVSVENPMEFLKSTISGDNENKFVVISDLLSAAQISREEVAEFLCEEIVAAISKCQVSDHSTIMFWGYDFDSNFHLVLELCSDPSLLASKLLSVVKNFGTTQKEAKHQVYYVVVELIIRAHKCYTAACNMEGIAIILRKSRLLTSKLLKREEWGLMVRLLTGVERYMEMSYIFQILKEHEQFEFLLSKGMDKVWGLKLAVLDFLKTYCPDDKNLFRMVALHFSMYSEVASLWESDAKSLILKVLEMARTEVNSKTSIVFTNNDQTKHILQTAMDNLTHAAQYYIKAKKLNKAMSTAHKAELVALQISLLNFSSSGQTVNCLLELNSQEVANVIIHKLSFPQAYIVAQAYGHPTDWGAVLYQHCIVNRETTYLAEFTNCMALTATLISDVARRFQMDANITQEMAVEMKKFVACVKSIEVKYRVASQLGFKDIVHGMLNGPDVAYLKDTIWKTGYKRQH